ncbi:hypothetical protein BO94DRAFT_492523 [Aspergillus sclerotioniger CBS 115572]|uniref:non-specific serine/threonine protein kinase n=1 Tax=Aspergillus sclerotioniger CBS 115572 TaxID=1450535 RepID=A0A317WSK5_9EURO|nr:hypothetical protein BO94DRAFT_492523 [Aspergillus sclerotioniger CBS 115572]PWY87180.1 hypothetical protein BO94DRAFT_492523 [Aspergillus sclerotioniger CBS 115572]
MLSPSSPVVAAGNTTPGRWTSRPATRTRTGTQRKVYGKRKADAPRAVFEQRSPAKALEKEEKKMDQEAVDGLREKLAEVTIEEKHVAQEPEDHECQEIRKEAKEIIEEEAIKIDESEHEEPAPEAIHTPDIEPQDEQTPAEELSSETIHDEEAKYETMVEVRISQKVSVDRPRRRKQAPEVTTEDGRRSARKDKPAPRLSSGCITDEKTNSYVRSILNEALSPVAAQSVQKFGSWAARAGNLLEVVKIAEGSYGEVYKLRLREELCKKEMSKSKLARLKAYGDGVFKVVPLRAQSGPGSKKFTSIEEIVSEVKMLKYLDPIPGFARFREIHVVQGRFPESFQKAWDHYKKTKDDCLNPNPSSKRAYPDTQLWAIIEMDDAGCELEKFSWSSIFQIYDIFWGVAMALARAEEYALFEHRDLHLGNVCIRSTRPEGHMDPPTDHEIISQSFTSGFGLSTLETTIIDYSLSRAELRISEETELVEVASSDLDKKQIFDAIGRDEDEIMLRNTYRHMRAQLYHGDPLQTEKSPDIPGVWAEYAPRTNLVWLIFLLKSLLKNRKSEPSTSMSTPTASPRQPLAPCSPNKAVAKQTGKKQEYTKPRVTAATQEYISQLKKTLEDRLDAVLELLDLENGHEDMCCAADLVAYAIDTQWLGEEDFF